MIRPRKLLFVLTDGARARLVERSSETASFSTTMEMDRTRRLKGLRAQLKANAAGRSFESVGSARHAVSSRTDRIRLEKEAFVAEVAEQAASAVERLGLGGAVIAAPPRLLGVLKERLAPRTAIVGALGKDLIKVPDHELHAWLDEAVYGAAPAA